jgi:beta-phosphoglucomutase-like phosphatase (HAD superfamily)
MVSALVFDVDGTLADTEEMHRRAFNAAFRAHELDWNWDAERYCELLRVTGGKERIACYIDSLPLAGAEKERRIREVPKIHATKTVVFANLVQLGGVPLRPGIRRLMNEARAAGVALVIASTTTLENVRTLLIANLGAPALRWFSAIAAGDAVRRKKPAPDIYELALADSGVAARNAVALEDSALGVCSAKSAGLFTIATPNAWTARQSFAAADLVLPCLGEPDEPLPASEALRIGAPFLGIEQIKTLHQIAKESP